MMKSRTLKEPFVVEGIGLHTGAAARVEVHPAPAPCGRIFVRSGVEIPALAEYVIETRRCTTLGYEGQTISTVEHFLAACQLAGVDHAMIVVDGPELPVLDGSALQWYQAICAAGVCPLEAELPQIVIPDARWIVEGDSEFFLLPSTEYHLYAALNIPDTAVTHMVAGGQTEQPEIREQIARARTFGLEREVAALLEAGLAKGGSIKNAVILTQTGYLNEHVWPNEPAWHKVLDLLGDLALVGAQLHGNILAVRGGHRSHVALARRLRTEYLYS